MDKYNANIIIFEEDDSHSNQNRHLKTMHASKSQSTTNNTNNDVIQLEINFLSEKIRSLELQADNLQMLKNESDTFIHSSKNNSHSQQCKHSEILLFAIEKKIQILVKQTKQVVERLVQSFDKKLELKMKQRNDQNGLSKIKQNFSQTVKKMEDHYRKEIEKISKEQKQIENKMIQKLSEVEQQLANKMNDYEKKEQQYIDWIHHLEIQLKEKMQKSKKMIEITQKDPYSIARKTSAENNSILSNHLETASQVQRLSPAPSENSKLNRKHKIFDGFQKGSSVSPSLKVNTQNSIYTTKLVNPAIKACKTITQSQAQPIKQPQQRSTRGTDIVKFQTLEVESSPWKVIDKSYDRELTKRNHHEVKDQNEDQFYKDVPKANFGWEQFQDVKNQENDSSGSDSEDDVFFYPEGNRDEEVVINNRSNHHLNNIYSAQTNLQKNNFYQSKKDSLPYQSKKMAEEKVFSPFDLN